MVLGKLQGRIRLAWRLSDFARLKFAKASYNRDSDCRRCATALYTPCRNAEAARVTHVMSCARLDQATSPSHRQGHSQTFRLTKYHSLPDLAPILSRADSV